MRWTLVIGVILFGITPPARASSSELWVESGNAALAADVSSTFKHEEHSSLSASSVVLSGQYGLEHFSLTLDWGFCNFFSMPDHGDGDATLLAGNPMGAFFFESRGDALSWRAGLQVAAPLADVHLGPDGRLESATYNYAMAMAGFWNLWQWAPSRFGMAVPAEFQWISAKSWRLRLQAALAILVPTQKRENTVDLITQLAADVSERPSPRFPAELGVRFQAVIIPTAPVDAVQISGEPFVRFDIGYFFAIFGILLNFDAPLGGDLAIDPGSLRFAVGGLL